MSTTITAGNPTNGLALSSDNAGILEFKTGNGAGTTALTLSTSQVATFANAVISAGLITGVTGALYPIILPSAAVPFTAVTTLDFTNIPSWVKRVTIMINSLGTNGSSDPLIQLGDSGGIENTGYVAAASLATASSVAFSSTAGFPISGSWSSAFIYSGVITLVLQDAATNTWTASSSGGRTDTSGGTSGGGYKSLSATLDRIRLTTVTAVNTFDASGTINILYE